MLDVEQNDSGSYYGVCINVETQISAAFELKQTEAIDRKDKYVHNEARCAEGSANTIVSDNGLLAKFDKFPKLPAELRLMIWREALPGPRLVNVIFEFKDNYTRFGTRPLYCKSCTPHPAMLHVCRESREEALKKYSLCFAMFSGQGKIYFDMNVDNFLITCDDLMDLLTSLNVIGGLRMPSFQGLRHLTLLLCPSMRDVEPREIIFLVQDLQRLETITLALHEDHQCSLAWHDVPLHELEAAEEPEGYRRDYDFALNDTVVRIWPKPPVLKFMGICDTAES